jgi:hypothetical protein
VIAVEEGVIAQGAAAYCESIWETNAQIVAAFDSDVDEVRGLGWVPGSVAGFEEDLPPTRGTYLAVCIYDVRDQPGTVDGVKFGAYWAGTDGKRGGMSSIAEW